MLVRGLTRPFIGLIEISVGILLTLRRWKLTFFRCQTDVQIYRGNSVSSYGENVSVGPGMIGSMI